MTVPEVSPELAEAGPGITIIGRAASINVRKVLWTCAEIGLGHRLDDDWDGPAREARRPELRALNPNDQFPVLLDRHGALWESNTICRYLAAEHGRADLLPTQPRARAEVEKWMDWQATELNGAWRYAFMALVRRSPDHQHAGEVAASIDAWNARMQVLEAQLERTRAYVAGSGFTLADIVLGVSVNRWLLTPIDRPALPAVSAFRTRLRDRAGFVAHVDTGVP